MIDTITSGSDREGICQDPPTGKPFSCTLAICILFHAAFWFVAFFGSFFAGAVFGAYMLFFGLIAFVIDLIRVSGIPSKETKWVLGRQIITGVLFNNYGVLLASAFIANHLIALSHHR